MSFLAANSGDAADPVPPAPNDPPALPWQRAVAELAQSLGPRSAEAVIQEACEQWAAIASTNWHRRDATLQSQLADLQTDLKRAVSELSNSREDCRTERISLQAQLYACRTVLEECRPIIKSVLVEREEMDQAIITRIADALAPAPRTPAP